MLELLLLAGFYRTVSYLTNALRLPLEPYAARFPAEAVSDPPGLTPSRNGHRRVASWCQTQRV